MHRRARLLGLYAEDRDGPSVPALIGDENPNPQISVVFVVPGFGENAREDEVEMPIPEERRLPPPREMRQNPFGIWEEAPPNDGRPGGKPGDWMG
jgi:hypothetical protein